MEKGEKELVTVLQKTKEDLAAVYQAFSEIQKKLAKVSEQKALNDFRRHVSEDFIFLQSSTPTVTFTSPHEEVARSSVAHMQQPYAKISHKGITLSSQQAKEKFERSGYVKITGSQIKGTIRNSSLGKMETIPDHPIIAEMAKHIFEVISLFINNWQTEGRPIDILTLRKKAKNQRITAANIVSFAEKAGYKEVIFNTCRSPLGIREEEKIIFDARNTTLLKDPVFKSWGDMPLDLTVNKY